MEAFIDRAGQDAGRYLVGQAGAALLGVSGHCLASLDLGTEVTKTGEYGTYTVVQWEGHQGYMETAFLVKPADFVEASAGPEQRRGDDLEGGAVETGRFGIVLPWRRRKVPKQRDVQKSAKKQVA